MKSFITFFLIGLLFQPYVFAFPGSHNCVSISFKEPKSENELEKAYLQRRKMEARLKAGKKDKLEIDRIKEKLKVMNREIRVILRKENKKMPMTHSVHGALVNSSRGYEGEFVYFQGRYCKTK